MFDKYEWIVRTGTGDPKDLTLLSLSTCGFCSAARDYMDERELAYRYLHLDEIDPADKAEIKEEFKGKFGRRPSFPSLVIQENRFLIGFIRKHWDEEVFPELLED